MKQLYGEQCSTPAAWTEAGANHHGGELSTRPTYAEQLITTAAAGGPCQCCQPDLLLLQSGVNLVSPALLCCCKLLMHTALGARLPAANPRPELRMLHAPAPADGSW